MNTYLQLIAAKDPGHNLSVLADGILWADQSCRISVRYPWRSGMPAMNRSTQSWIVCLPMAAQRWPMPAAG